MSTLFWIFVGVCVIANMLFAKYVFAPWLRRNMYVKDKDAKPPSK